MEHLNIYGRCKTCAYLLHYNMHNRQKKMKFAKTT